MKKRVLILDDDLSLARSLAREFEDHGYIPFIATALKELKGSFDFAVVDLRLTGEFGLDALDIIKNHSPNCRIIVFTGYGSISTAVEAIRLGAVNYVTKPASFNQIEAALLGVSKNAEPQFKARSLSQVEHEYIDFILAKNNGNISRTAKDLGIHRQSLQRKLKKYV